MTNQSRGRRHSGEGQAGRQKESFMWMHDMFSEAQDDERNGRKSQI